MADGRVSITVHAKQRMLERSISMRRVLRCLGNGEVIGNPWRDQGNWKVKIQDVTTGVELFVIAAIVADKDGEKALVVTTYEGG